MIHPSGLGVKGYQLKKSSIQLNTIVAALLYTFMGSVLLWSLIYDLAVHYGQKRLSVTKGGIARHFE